MTDPLWLLRSERRLRVDRVGRVRAQLIDELRRRDRAPEPRRCCPPPAGICCWEAV